MYDARWKLCVDLGKDEGDEYARRWPIGPEEFDTLIQTKTFSNGDDPAAGIDAGS